MFGGFQNGWSAGLNQFSDLSEKVQKLKTGLEAGLQDSGLLGPGEVPVKAEGSHKDAVAGGSQGAASGLNSNSKTGCKSDAHGSEVLWTGADNDRKAWGQEAEPEAHLGAGTEATAALTAEVGWDEQLLTLAVPVEEPAQRPEPARSELAQQEEGTAQVAVSAPVDSDGEEPGVPPRDEEEAAVADSSSLISPAEPSSMNASETPRSDTIEAMGSQEADASLPREEAEGESAIDSTLSNSEVPNGVVHMECEERGSPRAAADAKTEVHQGGERLPETAPLSHEAVQPENVFREPPTAQPEGKAQEGKSEEQVREMPLNELQGWALQLQATLLTRELQLERKFEEAASMQEVTQQLMGRNEELARKAAKASEEDIKQLTDECEARLGALERKVYALTKERDMLRRGTEKLSSANDLLKEKDHIIAQVMAEGERLSKKQLAQESTIKMLRQQLKEAEFSRKEIAAEAAVERKKFEETLAAAQKAEADLAAARSAHKAELEAEKGHYESLVSRARAAQVEAENKAAVSAKEGLFRKLREAETRAEMLVEQVADLQMSMERQRNAADAREDMLKRELTERERWNQEADARHEELTNKLPEATQPLLRQIEGMQRTAAAHARAWAGAEQSLQSRLEEAEALAASAAEKERSASDRLHAANSRALSLGAALDTVRDECADVHSKLEAREGELQPVRQRCSKLEEQCDKLLSKMDAMESEKAELERSLELRMREAEQANLRVLAAAEARAAALEERLRQHHPLAPAGTGEPPATAGPGTKWVLQREDEDLQTLQQRQDHTGPSPRVTYVGSMSRVTALELERMRDALVQKEEQLAMCQDTISKLEATRDSLAEELVSFSQTAEQHAGAWRELEATRCNHSQTQQKLVACTELLGEREEKILELTADISDMKALYREQIEYVLDMAEPSSHSGAASSVSSWVPGPER